MTLFKKLLAAAAITTLAPIGAQAAVMVDVQLVLAVDVSGSVNTPRYLAQKTGYVNAFRNPIVHNAITNGTLGSIAVTYMEWSGGTQQSQQVGWTQISSAAEANLFADAIEATIRAFNGLTGIAAAIDWSMGSIAQNGFDSARKVIDISGDGSENVCSPAPGCLQTSRDAAVAAGITINGIAIEEVTSFSLTDYYRDNVIGGAGSFVLTAATFDDFEAAILQKLRVEISGGDPTPVPEPGTLALLGLGLAGLGALRRRKLQA